MSNVPVYNMDGKEVGKIDLNDAIFGVEVNEHLVHLAVVSRLANERQGTQKAKTRSEVSGGGRKPWRLNKKEKRAALKSVLTSKVNDGNLIVLDELKFDEIKTKAFKQVMDNLEVDNALVVIDGNDKNVVLSARNIKNINTTPADSVNVYDVLKAKKLVLTKDSVKKIEEVYA